MGNVHSKINYSKVVCSFLVNVYFKESIRSVFDVEDLQMTASIGNTSMKTNIQQHQIWIKVMKTNLPLSGLQAEILTIVSRIKMSLEYITWI